MKTKAMILFAALFFIESAARMQAQCLTLEVRDIDRPQGFLYVAFYSSPDNFLKKRLSPCLAKVCLRVPTPLPSSKT